MRPELVWTQSNGGPLLLLEGQALPRWQGASNEHDPIDPTTDYGRACAAFMDDVHGILTIPVGPFDALVLGDDPTLPAALAAADDGILVVRTFRSAGLDLSSLPRQDALDWTIACTFTVRSSPLVLFDAAFPGDEAMSPPAPCEERLPALTIPCAPGSFVVETATTEVPDGEVVLHRLRTRAS